MFEQTAAFIARWSGVAPRDVRSWETYNVQDEAFAGRGRTVEICRVSYRRKRVNSLACLSRSP